jgi:hypothetical protein
MKYLKTFETMQFAVLKNAKDIADREKERRDKKKEEESAVKAGPTKPEATNRPETEESEPDGEPEEDE